MARGSGKLIMISMPEIPVELPAAEHGEARTSEGFALKALDPKRPIRVKSLRQRGRVIEYFIRQAFNARWGATG